VQHLPHFQGSTPHNSAKLLRRIKSPFLRRRCLRVRLRLHHPYTQLHLRTMPATPRSCAQRAYNKISVVRFVSRERLPCRSIATVSASAMCIASMHELLLLRRPVAVPGSNPAASEMPLHEDSLTIWTGETRASLLECEWVRILPS